MSRKDVITVLKDALKRQHLDQVQMNGCEVARYLRARYFSNSAEGEEETTFREENKRSVQKKKTLLKENPEKSDAEVNKKPLTMLQKLTVGGRRQNPLLQRNQMARQKSNKYENDTVAEVLPSPSRSFSFTTLPSSKNSEDIKEEETGTASKIRQHKVTPNRGPWPKYRAFTAEKPNSPAAEFRDNKTLKRVRSLSTSKSKLSALGEATLRAVRERKERKERQLAIAKMEARQAKIAELRARAESALSRAKEVFQGIV